MAKSKITKEQIKEIKAKDPKLASLLLKEQRDGESVLTDMVLDTLENESSDVTIKVIPAKKAKNGKTPTKSELLALIKPHNELIA